MRLVVLSSFVSVLALLPIASADEPKTPAEKFQALVKAQEKAQKDFSDAYRAAKTDADREKVSKELGTQSMPESHARAFLALMKEHPKDPAALDALGWLLGRAAYSPEAGQAVDAVIRDWADDPRLKAACEPPYHSNPARERLYRAAIEKSPHKEVQGFAHYSLALSLKLNADGLVDRPAAAREPLEKEADQLLQKVIDRYADIKHFTTLGQEAEQLRFELRHLAIGKTPPEIEGEDLDGKKLKLSEFRGKVTLVVFWAGWCGPCMGDVPHEREILKRYEGKPFAIVGINGDKDAAAGRAAVQKAEIPWRSFADCKGGSGPIVKRWNVDSWPTLYLLDGTGTIRFKGGYLRTVSARSGKDGKLEQYNFLDDAVEVLMKEAEKKP
jgi:thiol-disulfide isomerase/thioredoxin